MDRLSPTSRCVNNRGLAWARLCDAANDSPGELGTGDPSTPALEAMHNRARLLMVPGTYQEGHSPPFEPGHRKRIPRRVGVTQQSRGLRAAKLSSVTRGSAARPGYGHGVGHQPGIFSRHHASIAGTAASSRNSTEGWFTCHKALTSIPQHLVGHTVAAAPCYGSSVSEELEQYEKAIAISRFQVHGTTN